MLQCTLIPNKCDGNCTYKQERGSFTSLLISSLPHPHLFRPTSSTQKPSSASIVISYLFTIKQDAYRHPSSPSGRKPAHPFSISRKYIHTLHDVSRHTHTYIHTNTPAAVTGTLYAYSTTNCAAKEPLIEPLSLSPNPRPRSVSARNSPKVSKASSSRCLKVQVPSGHMSSLHPIARGMR